MRMKKAIETFERMLASKYLVGEGGSSLLIGLTQVRG
jgi:hypothetical protein